MEFRSAAYRGAGSGGSVVDTGLSSAGSIGGGSGSNLPSSGVASGATGASGSTNNNINNSSSGVGGGVLNNNELPHSPTPPLQRRLAKSFSVAPSSAQTKGASFLFKFYLIAL